MDSRLKLLSHSSRCLLHTCPRKYQLTKVYPEAKRDATVHTEYGKAFGEGIQAILTGASYEEAILRAVMNWNIDLSEELPNKSVWSMITAIERFKLLQANFSLGDYEVARFLTDKGEERFATELSFCIVIPGKEGNYYERGYIDVVLRHKITGSLLVVDVKTSGANYTNEAKYKNSGQGIGYSVIIDQIAPGVNQFDVMYFEYLTGTKKYTEHVFVVGVVQRANWIRNLLLDIAAMERYDEYEDWPMYGESCASFGSACQFIDCCTMSTSALTLGRYCTDDALEYDGRKDLKRDKEFKKTEYDFVIKLEDLIANQLDR